MIVHMIGNAHIDPVWLWPWQAGVDETLATFRSAIDRCAEYPEFIFTRGEAWTYRIVEQLDARMFSQVQKLVETGQWHITGGQWIQPDINLPTWAGLKRQIIHGQRYFTEKFNVTADVGYNVDSFGHPATLPDLLAEMGYLGYVFHRPNAAQVELPAATFRWRGVGGGEVLGFRIPAAYTTRLDDLYGQIMLSLDAADEKIGHVMCFYGVGNHGGGPTKGNIEYILNNRNTFAGAELQFSTPQRFFQCLRDKKAALPLVETELQKTFPGCYVVMQAIKQEQRHGEHLLQQAQRAIDTWAENGDGDRLREKLDLAWEDLLFTEFHDILAGTSIASAWPSVRAIQGRARINGEEIITHVTRKHARRHMPKANFQQIAIFNPGEAAFDGFVQHEPFLDFAALGDRWLCDEDGQPIPMQQVKPQSTIMLTSALLFPLRIDSGATRTLTLRDDARPDIKLPSSALSVSEMALSNPQVSLQLGGSGIGQIRCNGRDLLARGGLTLRLRDDTADTWGFKIDRFAGAVTDVMGDCKWTVAETGPLRGRVRGAGTVGRSPVKITITLWRDRPTIELQLEVLYIEQFRLLQMALDLPAAAPAWRCGLAGGAITREPSPIEWPLQGWAHPTGTDTPTLAVLTQDANSASLDGTAWAWSLLRSTRMAWAGGDVSNFSGEDDLADGGAHTFKFHLQPLQSGAANDAQCAAQAAMLAQPLVVFDRYEGMNRPPWGTMLPRRLWTPAEHRARKDGRLMDLPDDGQSAVEE